MAREFVEFTLKKNAKRVLLSTSAIHSVYENNPNSTTICCNWYKKDNVEVAQSFDEVQKRLGMAIAPRGGH